MAVHDAVDVLSRLLEAYGSGPAEVRTVEASTAAEDALSAEVALAVPLDGGASDGEPVAAELTADGGIRVEVQPPRPPELSSAGASLSVTERDVSLGPDGNLLLDLEVAIEAPGGTDPESASTPGESAPPAGRGPDGDDDGAAPDGGEVGDADSDRLEAVRTEGVPPYEDVPYLRSVYETCETFAEMRDRIGMDVAAETVRRYMIDAGVHDPASYETTDGPLEGDEPAAGSSPADAGEEQLVTDGLGLPEGVEVGTVLEAVVESATVYEVERRLGLGEQRTRELLRELDLLELVLHRVSEAPGRECTYEEAAMRVRRRASGGA